MKQKRSIDEALNAAKAMRKQVTVISQEEDSAVEAHLKVVDSGLTVNTESNPKSTALQASATESDQPTVNMATRPKPIWVRHTVGLLDTTSLSLRDAADGQKRKERHGQLKPDEPANEQEIADLGITLALKQLGYL